MITKHGIWILFAVALLFRIVLIPVARHGDINNNTSWGQLLLTQGPNNFYDNKPQGGWPYSEPNQPPLYLYLFATTSFFQNTVTNSSAYLNTHFSLFPSSFVWTWDQWGEIYFAKLPAIIADLGIALVIYKFLEKKKRLAIIISTLWLINPISWYNSSIWGGTDSIVNLFGIISVYWLLEKKNILLTFLFFTLSLLFKGSLSLFLPLIMIVAVKQKHSVLEWMKAASVSIIAVVIICFPFHSQLDLLSWLFKLYTQRFFPGEIGSLTANAFNLWWIVDSGKTLDSALYFGVAARIWGLVITLICYLSIFVRFKKKLEVSQIVGAFMIIPLISFLFMTRMHERYLYPFFPIGAVALAYFDWLWVPYVLISVAHLFNLYHLFWAPGLPIVEKWYLDPLFMTAFAILNLIIFVYILARYHQSLRHKTSSV